MTSHPSSLPCLPRTTSQASCPRNPVGIKGFRGAEVWPIQSDGVVGPRAKRDLYFSALPLSAAAGPRNCLFPSALVQGKTCERQSTG
jgi:hypothetical protein